MTSLRPWGLPATPWHGPWFARLPQLFGYHEVQESARVCKSKGLARSFKMFEATGPFMSILVKLELHKCQKLISILTRSSQKFMHGTSHCMLSLDIAGESLHIYSWVFQHTRDVEMYCSPSVIARVFQRTEGITVTYCDCFWFQWLSGALGSSWPKKCMCSCRIAVT